jgi:hypothetical protein
MYILINFNEDGDSYNFFTDLEKARTAFNDSKYNAAVCNYTVFLLKIQPGVEFGFGSRGEVYGAEVIDSSELDNFDIERARLITSDQYLALFSPEFEGQTQQDSDGNYKMYWKSEGLYYYTQNNITT